MEPHFLPQSHARPLWSIALWYKFCCIQPHSQTHPQGGKGSGIRLAISLAQHIMWLVRQCMHQSFWQGNASTAACQYTRRHSAKGLLYTIPKFSYLNAYIILQSSCYTRLARNFKLCPFLVRVGQCTRRSSSKIAISCLYLAAYRGVLLYIASNIGSMK